jgi:protein PhnA
MERTLLVCESCLKALASPKHLRGREWQFLQTTVWSELPATQVVAYRMLKVLSLHEDWALNTIEELFLDPEIESWALAAPL